MDVDKGEGSHFCKPQPRPLDGLGPPKDVRASMSCSSVPVESQWTFPVADGYEADGRGVWSSFLHTFGNASRF